MHGAGENILNQWIQVITMKLWQLNSYELFNYMLENFKRLGIKVIIDVHSAETDNQGHTHPLWFKGKITEEIFKKLGCGLHMNLKTMIQL